MGFSIAVLVVLVQAVRGFINRRKLASPTPRASRNALRDASVTFLVAAWNAEDDIIPFIESFHSLPIEQKQLVLCAGGTDKTLELAQRCVSDDVSVIAQHRGEGKQGALAKAFDSATGEIIFLTDIDCRLTADSVYPLLAYLTQHPDEVATGRVRPLGVQCSNNFVLMQWAIREQGMPASGTVVGGLDGRNTAMFRSMLQETQALQVPAPSGTDYTLAKELIRHGFTIRFIGVSRMETEFPPDLSVYVKKQARWLRNVLVLGRRYGAKQDVRATVRTLAFPWVSAVLIASGIYDLNLLGIGVALIIYSITNRVLYLRNIGAAQAAWSSFTVLLGDWSAAILTVRHLYRRNFGWS